MIFDTSIRAWVKKREKFINSAAMITFFTTSPVFIPVSRIVWIPAYRRTNIKLIFTRSRMMVHPLSIAGIDCGETNAPIFIMVISTTILNRIPAAHKIRPRMLRIRLAIDERTVSTRSLKLGISKSSPA